MFSEKDKKFLVDLGTYLVYLLTGFLAVFGAVFLASSGGGLVGVFGLLILAFFFYVVGIIYRPSK